MNFKIVKEKNTLLCVLGGQPDLLYTGKRKSICCDKPVKFVCTNGMWKKLTIRCVVSDSLLSTIC